MKDLDALLQNLNYQDKVLALLANGCTVEISSTVFDAVRNAFSITFSTGEVRLYNYDGVNQFRPEFNIVKLTLLAPKRIVARSQLNWFQRYVLRRRVPATVSSLNALHIETVAYKHLGEGISDDQASLMAPDAFNHEVRRTHKNDPSLKVNPGLFVVVTPQHSRSIVVPVEKNNEAG